MAACIRCYKSISEMVSISSKPSILKLWFSQHCWYYSHFLQLGGLNEKLKQKSNKQETPRKHNTHLLSNGKRCCQNYLIQFFCQPASQYQLSEFNKNAVLVVTLKYFRTHLKRYRFVRHPVYSIICSVVSVNSSGLTIILYIWLEQYSVIKTLLILSI
jgi:hypothetical protein